ncbi:MAG: type II toxin-antitoxin system YafQ family toxin [Clostridiales Family XIII bacterium]|jgi:mRNA interferase YafQ|nr:type II toxin-antitoxin system YafQ family toxin [Clostridiales Family XIII bacterium]
MLRIAQTNLFKKQIKQCRKRGWDMGSMSKVVNMLQKGEALPERHRDHALSGDRTGQRDCHVKPDWILIYRVREDVLVLQLLETGSHSDLSL